MNQFRYNEVDPLKKYLNVRSNSNYLFEFDLDSSPVISIPFLKLVYGIEIFTFCCDWILPKNCKYRAVLKIDRDRFKIPFYPETYWIHASRLEFMKTFPQNYKLENFAIISDETGELRSNNKYKFSYYEHKYDSRNFRLLGNNIKAYIINNTRLDTSETIRPINEYDLWTDERDFSIDYHKCKEYCENENIIFSLRDSTNIHMQFLNHLNNEINNLNITNNYDFIDSILDKDNFNPLWKFINQFFQYDRFYYEFLSFDKTTFNSYINILSINLQIKKSYVRKLVFKIMRLILSKSCPFLDLRRYNTFLENNRKYSCIIEQIKSPTLKKYLRNII